MTRIHRDGELDPEEGEVVTLGLGYNPTPEEMVMGEPLLSTMVGSA